MLRHAARYILVAGLLLALAPASLAQGGLDESGCTKLDSANYLGETVKMTTVDALNLPKMRLLKVDVEGMELDVVRGAVKTINMFKPALYMRAHYNPADNTLSTSTQDLARFVQVHKLPTPKRARACLHAGPHQDLARCVQSLN